MEDNRIRYALIGCGRISPNHIRAVLDHADKMCLCAVCDVIPERMEEALAPLSESERARVKRYTDYKEMLSAEKPQWVSVAVESGRHAAVGLDCIRAGCHTLIEKPIALSLEDADTLIAQARQYDVRLCACHQNRFNPPIQKLREALTAGRFGRLAYGTAHVRWYRDRDYFRQGQWRGTWALDGGALMNQCIHDIDLLRWMMGDEITEVFAYASRQVHPYIEAEDMGLALVRFKNGAYGMIEGTTDAYPDDLEETLYLFGERGTVKVGGRSVNRLDTWRFADATDEENSEAFRALYSDTPENVYGHGHTLVYQDMLDAIACHRAPFIDGEAGRRALELVLAIYKSARDGKPVSLPLTSFSTLDMTDAFERPSQEK